MKPLYLGANKRCYICGESLNLAESTRDHIYPKSLGYGIKHNVMLAHQNCNTLKADRIPTIAELTQVLEAYDRMNWIFNPTVHPNNIWRNQKMTAQYKSQDYVYE